MNDLNTLNQLLFPTNNTFSVQNLENKFINWTDTECKDDSFHYSLLVSKKCEPLDPQTWINQTAKPFTTCSKFQSLNEDMTLSVEFSLVDRELNAGDFVNALQKHSGEKIINLRRENGLNEGNGDVLSKVDVRGLSYIKRTYSLRHGNRIFRIQANVKEQNYVDWAEEILVSLASFKLLNPKFNSTIEELKIIQLEEQGFQFTYPCSWNFENLDSGSNGNSFFRLTSNEETLDSGEIFIFTFFAKESIHQAAQTFVNYLRREGFQVKGFPLISEKIRKDIAKSSLAFSFTQKNDTRKQIALVIHEFEESIALIGLNCPLAETNPMSWAISKKCFEIICNSIERY